MRYLSVPGTASGHFVKFVRMEWTVNLISIPLFANSFLLPLFPLPVYDRIVLYVRSGVILLYCHQCGENLPDDARFCSSCGMQINRNSDEMKMQTQETIEPPGENLVEKGSTFVQLLPIILPIFSLVILAAGLAFYYFQEQKTNQEVLTLRKAAEKEALKEEYEKAIDLLEKASSKRPSYSILNEEIKVIKRAKDYQDAILSIGEKIKSSNFAEASKELASLKEKINQEQGSLFEQFPQKLEDREVKITVGSIKQELNALNSIDELGGKLTIITTLPEKEANAVKQEILKKIVQISTDQVEKFLADKQFSEAFTTIDKGLSFAVNDKKLLGLKERVQQDKLAFEKAEQQRIEKAMEAAAQEDLKNRTAAVQVSDFSVEVDGYGDLHVSGSVKNVATTGINSITIYYTIYDEYGQYFDDSYTSVYPYYLASGEVGTFDDIYYGVYQNVNVEIDNITWYLN